MRRAKSWTLEAWRLWAAVVLLLVVLIHAAVPLAQDRGQNQGQDRGRTRGSAFSASTDEVSLKSETRALVVKELLRLDPPGPLPEAPAVAGRAAILPMPRVPDDAVPVQPVADTTLHPISPRAPPFA